MSVVVSSGGRDGIEVTPEYIKAFSAARLLVVMVTEHYEYRLLAFARRVTSEGVAATAAQADVIIKRLYTMYLSKVRSVELETGLNLRIRSPLITPLQSLRALHSDMRNRVCQLICSVCRPRIIIIIIIKFN